MAANLVATDNTSQIWSDQSGQLVIVDWLPGSNEMHPIQYIAALLNIFGLSLRENAKSIVFDERELYVDLSENVESLAQCLNLCLSHLHEIKRISRVGVVSRDAPEAKLLSVISKSAPAFEISVRTEPEELFDWAKEH